MEFAQLFHFKKSFDYEYFPAISDSWNADNCDPKYGLKHPTNCNFTNGSTEVCECCANLFTCSL